MAKFHDLSVDLLYVIFSYLQSDKPLLQDIALSCHLFRDVAQRFFVRDVQISHSPTRSRTKLFLRTLEERPDLIAHVHRLELDLLREDVSWPEEQHCISQITALLFNLREFRYSSRDYKIWHYEIAFPLSLTPENTHSFVRKVEWNHNMTIKTFHECMKLPRIESLYCRELHASDEELENHGKAFERVSSLTDLHLGSSMSSVSLPVEFFRKVLQMPRRLRSLRIDFRDDYRDRVTPEQFAGLLEPVQESLEELTITKTKATTASTGDHHSIDLSGFPMLTKVSLPLKFVFPKGVQSPPFEAETILPPRLNELKLFYIPYTRDTDHTIAHANFCNLITWLADMHPVDSDPHSRCLRVPNLRHIVLEQTKCGGYHSDLDEESVQDIINIWKKFEEDASMAGKLRVRHIPPTDGVKSQISEILDAI